MRWRSRSMSSTLTLPSWPISSTSLGWLTCDHESSEMWIRPSMPSRSTKAPKSTMFEICPSTTSPGLSRSRICCRCSLRSSSSTARRESTTLLRERLSSITLQRSSWARNSSRSCTRRMSTREAGRKPRTPRSRIRPPLTTSITLPSTGSPDSAACSIAFQAISKRARFFDRISRPSESSFVRTSASISSPMLTSSAGFTVRRIESPATGFPGAAVPIGLGITDENAAGAADVVSANVRRSVSVLLGRGDGRLQRGIAFRADGEHEGAAVADLNHDGVADAVLFDQFDAVSVLLADGHGHFGAPVRYAAGRRPWTGAVGDLNGDGAPDIVAIDWGKDDISTADDRLVALLNNGDGTFAPAIFAPAPPTELPWSLGAADLNHDGHADVVETTDLSFANVLLGRGDGTFDAPQTLATDGRSTGLDVTDLNDDGKPDLAVGHDGGNVDVFLGKGDGSFGPSKPALLDLFQANTIVPGDFNGDGHLDLAPAPFEDLLT